MWGLKRNKKTGTEALDYAGEFDGERVYVFKSAGLLPTKRYLYFVTATNDAELGISRADVRAFVTGVRNAINAKDLSRAGWFCETLDFYLNEYNPEKMLFKSGAVFIVFENEDINQVTDEQMKRKAMLFDTDDAFRAFFLQTTFRLLRNYGVLSKDTDDAAFSSMPRSLTERIYSQLTGRHIYWDYLKE